MLTVGWAHTQHTAEASTALHHTGAEVTPTGAETDLGSELNVLTDLISGPSTSAVQWWEDRLWNSVR